MQVPMTVTLRKRKSVAPHGANGQSPAPDDIVAAASGIRAAATGVNRSEGAVLKPTASQSRVVVTVYTASTTSTTKKQGALQAPRTARWSGGVD